MTFQVSTNGGTTYNKFGATKTLVSGSATSDSYTPASAGSSYRFRAVYNGDTNYVTVTGSATSLTVNKVTPTVAVTFTVNPDTVGTATTITATVTGVGGVTPTGTVTFSGGTGTYSPANGQAVLSGSGSTATCSVTFTPSAAGTPTITASYPTDSNYAAASGTGSLTVNAAPVSIIITSSPAGSGFVTVDGTSYSTPHTFTWTPGQTYTIAAISTVAGPSGTQYVWTGWSDSGAQSHSYTVPSSSATVTANYKTQYQVTFTQTGIDSSAGTNTILTVGTTNYAYNALPSSVYVDDGTTFNWASTVAGGTGKQFVKTGGSGTSPISGSGTYSATYNTQYQVTFSTRRRH